MRRPHIAPLVFGLGLLLGPWGTSRLGSSLEQSRQRAFLSVPSLAHRSDHRVFERSHSGCFGGYSILPPLLWPRSVGEGKEGLAPRPRLSAATGGRRWVARPGGMTLMASPAGGVGQSPVAWTRRRERDDLDDGAGRRPLVGRASRTSQTTAPEEFLRVLKVSP
jgi:hypothetical protein